MVFKRKVLPVWAVGGALAVSAIGLAACGANDASVSGRDHAPAEAINFPDHFSSVATKCNHGNRVYVADHGDGGNPSAVAVIAHDPSCSR